MTPGGFQQKHRRPVGAGLSLDKFASLGVSKFDKRRKLERLKKQKLIEHSKYRKLKQKLEAQGILSGAPVKDSVAELEALDAVAPSDSADGSDDGVDYATNSAERIGSHARAGPNSGQQARAQAEGSVRRQAIGAAAAAMNADQPRQGARATDKQASKLVGASGQSSERHEVLPQASARRPTAIGKRARGEGDAAAGPGGHSRQGHKRTAGHAGCDADAGQGGRKKPAAAHGGTMGEAREGQENYGDKKLSRLQRLAQRVAEEKAEKERAKEAAMKERMKKLAAIEKARKEEKHQHFKRNAKGQPLMRFRMEKLLSQIQKTGQ